MAPAYASPHRTPVKDEGPARIAMCAAYSRSMKQGPRFLLLIPGGIALLAGCVGALALLDMQVPGPSDRLMASHGVLMVLGFVGTVISLERAVALGKAWGYAAPALLGLGALVLLTPANPRIGGMCFVAGSLLLLAVYGALLKRYLAPETVVQALGAALAAGGALIWLGGAPVATALPWWAGFVILTIAGERAELARIEAPRMGVHTLRYSSMVIASVLAATLWPTLGGVLLGAALLALVGALVKADVARRMAGATGMPRYAAVAMLAGYAWLALAGALWLVSSPIAVGPVYDATIHAVFLGFTMSMIMAHAPMILPAVLRIKLPYVPIMYVPLVALHGSLVVRLLAGDAYGSETALTWGGAVNVAAVVAFMGVAVGTAVWAAVRERSPGTTPSAPAVKQQVGS